MSISPLRGLLTFDRMTSTVKVGTTVICLVRVLSMGQVQSEIAMDKHNSDEMVG